MHYTQVSALPCAVKAKALSSSDKLYLSEAAAFAVNVELPKDLMRVRWTEL